MRGLYRFLSGPDCGNAPPDYGARHGFLPQSSGSLPRRFTQTALVCLSVLVAGFFHVPDVLAAESTAQRFQRAAFVLQRIAPRQPWEAVNLPPNMERDDKASAFIHHSDRVFVLTAMAREMDSLGNDTAYPAAHYAALAYALLGRHADAARCMARHMATAPFRPDDALFLMRACYDNADYTALRDTAALWRKNAPACDTDRLALVWGSWINQRNYREALYAALSSPCKGWYPETLGARARLLMGETGKAREEFASLLLRYPEHADEARALWADLAARLRYP